MGYDRIPVTGKDYEILILRAGQEVSIFEPESANERYVLDVADRKSLCRGGRVTKKNRIRGYEISVEGAKVDSVLSILLTQEDGLNLKGEFVDPDSIVVKIRTKLPGTLLWEEKTYRECTIQDLEEDVQDLEGAIKQRFKIYAVKRDAITTVDNI